MIKTAQTLCGIAWQLLCAKNFLKSHYTVTVSDEARTRILCALKAERSNQSAALAASVILIIKKNAYTENNKP